MKIKNRNKVDTSPISIYYTRLIEEPELIIVAQCLQNVFSQVFHYWNKTAKF